VVELEESDGGEPDVAEAAVPGMGTHAHFDPLVRERGRQHLNKIASIGKAFKEHSCTGIDSQPGGPARQQDTKAAGINSWAP
jgi:hypothetical protein